MASKAAEIGEKALEKQFEIMEEQQKKGQEFVNKKVKGRLDWKYFCDLRIVCQIKLFRAI